MNLTAIATQPQTGGNPGLHVVPAPGTELAPARGTPRGKTHLSLAELQDRTSHYPQEIRDATAAAQAFFVEHCNSNIDMFVGVAKNEIKFPRSPEYFGNWMKGSYFRGGTGDVKGKGYSDWLEFCLAVAAHHTQLKTGGRTIVTGTIRAIAASIDEIYDLDNPCRIGGVAGATGTQKTEGLKYVAIKRGGFPHANYFDCTEGLGVSGLKRGIGDLFNCKVGNKAGVIDAEIGRNLGPDRGLFLDNIQRAVSTEDESAVIDWLLRMQEGRNFPLYLTFTKGFREGLEKNSFLEQLVGRIGGMSEVLVLNDYPPVADLCAFARHYDLADSAVNDYLKPWSRQLGRIRVVAKRLWRARQFAKDDGKDRITLDYLKAADAWIPPATLDLEDAS